MRVVKSLLVLWIALFMMWENIHAQRSNGKGIYNAVKSRGGAREKWSKAVFTDRYPYHGLGIKLGDPFAATYKFYATPKFSFVIDFGKLSTSLYNRYYRQRFSSYINTDTLSLGAIVNYRSHRAKTDLVGEVKMLYQLDGKEFSPGLQAYFGAGWQWKNTNLIYQYAYNAESPSDESAASYGVFKRSRLTMGPQIIAGIEYAYFQIPLSAFVELEYFTDIQADPGWNRFEGGFGMRYIF